GDGAVDQGWRSNLPRTALFASPIYIVTSVKTRFAVTRRQRRGSTFQEISTPSSAASWCTQWSLTPSDSLWLRLALGTELRSSKNGNGRRHRWSSGAASSDPR